MGGVVDGSPVNASNSNAAWLGKSGTMTAGAVVVVDTNQDANQDATYFTYDRTNHRLGLGTNSPNETLDLANTISVRASTDATAGNIDTLSTLSSSNIRLSGASPVLRGVANGSNGKLLLLTNVSGSILVINNQDSNPTAANRIITGSGANVTIPNDASVILCYDSTTSRWRLMGGGGGSVGELASAHIFVGNASNIATDVAMSGAISIDNTGATSYAGTVPVNKGGTGATTLTAHGVLLGNTTSAVNATTAGSSGQVLQSQGASADPTWSTATFPATATGTGTILRADGTNWAATTATYPSTTTVSQLLYSSSANVVAGLATANTAALVTNSSGVPSLTSGSTANRLLRTDGTTVSFAQAALATDVSGTLPIANGGTNNGSLSVAAGAALYTDGTKLVALAPGTSGQVYTSGGTGAPTWSSPLTNPMTTGGDIIYGGASGAATRLANGSAGQFLASAGGTSAPTWNTLQITNFVTFTMTITGTSSNPTKGTVTEIAMWRRVGDSMEIQYSLIQTVAGSAGSGSYLFLIPNSQTIDNTKINVSTDKNNSICGNCHISANSNASTADGDLYCYDTTHLVLSNGSIGGDVSSSNYGLNNGTVKYVFHARVPISGWSI